MGLYFFSNDYYNPSKTQTCITIVVCSYFKKTHSYDHRGMFLLQKNTFVWPSWQVPTSKKHIRITIMVCSHFKKTHSMTIVVCSYFIKTHSYDHRGMFVLHKNIFVWPSWYVRTSKKHIHMTIVICSYIKKTYFGSN